MVKLAWPQRTASGFRWLACKQFALYGEELWRRGEERETLRRANELQVLVNSQVRGITGCFRTINQSELMLESGLRPAMSLLKN